MRHCPALFISAPASGQGKTTVTAGLARLHRRRGLRVRVFKTGPDFLDPMILAQASGAPVYNLDLWMVGAAECRRRLYKAAAEADLILLEGVMGLYDGSPSSADLARTFGVPVLAVIAAQSMAQTFAAVAFGLARFQPGLPFYGVLANRAGSERHLKLLREALPPEIHWAGHLSSQQQVQLPSRHLGLTQADEIADLEQRLELAADAMETTSLRNLPPPVAFAAAAEVGAATAHAAAHAAHAAHAADEMATAAASSGSPRLLEGRHIAVARDAAFSFIYPANLELLEQLGARLSFFSPLANQAPGAADAVYLPGGYPELHLEQLSGNTVTAAALRAHHAAGKRIFAECGGMLYLLDRLTDAAGRSAAMCGILPGHARLQTRFTGLGMQHLRDTAKPTPAGGLRGHTFHYSQLETPMTPWLHASNPNSAAPGEAVYRAGPVCATYMHSYFASDPYFTASLFARFPDEPNAAF